MDEFGKFYNKALKLLSYRPCSEKEIRDRLLRKKVPEDVVSKIVSKLKEYKFLDDKEFIRWWIEQRTNFKPRSLRLIKFELKHKGIEKDLIDQVIDKLSLTIDDLASAKKLIEKRLHKYKNLSREVRFQKIARYLSSKGYNYDVIKKILKEVE